MLAGLAAVTLVRGAPSAKAAAAALVLAPFTITLFGNTYYTLDGRYAVMVLPAAAMVVGHGAALLTALRRPRVGVVPLVVAWAVLATAVPLWTQLPHDLVAPNRDVEVLADTLRAHGVSVVRADYWIAYRLVAVTDERVVASPIAPIKFLRYEEVVRAAEARGEAALVLFTAQVPDYLAGKPPFDRHQGFRSGARVHVGSWTVFLIDHDT